MITPINISNVQTFGSTKPQTRTQQTAKPQTTSHKHGSGIATKATAAAMAALATFSIASCSKKDAKPVNIEPTTSYGQVIKEQEELASAREEYESLVRASEKAEWEEMSQAEEERQQGIQDQYIKQRGVDYYLGLDLDDPEIGPAYKEVKRVFQNIGADKLNLIIGKSAEKYNFDITGLLALIVQQGGIPKISDAAKQDVADKYGLDPDSSSAIDMLVGYYAICSERGNGFSDQAAQYFTGSEQDLSSYERVISQLSGKQIEAIANNDAIAAYNESDFAD